MNHHDRKRANVAALLATAIAALALAACGSGEADEAAPAPDYGPALAKAPPPLADLYADGDAIIPGSEEEYAGLIGELRGYPVVVNHWASWCGPCRAEFPYFQSQAAERLDEVAFLGVDSEDADEAAETFLADNEVPYPSVADYDGEYPQWLGEPLVGLPNTVFYDRRGELVHVKQGPYTDEAELAADIERYALAG